MVGLVELSSSAAAGPGFSVSHQKLELEIDFDRKRIKGRTEIAINPHSKDLKAIRLNCRQSTLTRLNIDGRGPTLKYDEPYSRCRLHSQATVHQYHQLRNRIGPQLKEPPDQELLINLPKGLRIHELDPFSVEAQAIGPIRGPAGPARDGDDAGTVASTPVPRTADDSASRYAPFTLVVEFVVDKVRDGLQFVGCEDDDSRYPHAYTRNSSFPSTACCLFPCVDEITSRCTWEVVIRCPRTLGDLVDLKRISRASEDNHGPNGLPSFGRGDVEPATEPSNGHGPGSDLRSEPNSAGHDDERGLDITVICSGDLQDEIVDPLDRRKKIVSFFCSQPVAPQHIGFAVGPFEHIDLSGFRESDEDDKLGVNAIRLHGFSLPGRKAEVRNTCFPLAKAIDYFTLTYGAYPFTSYKLCFVDDMPTDYSGTASLSLCSTRLLFPEDIIDPLDHVSRVLVHGLANQWMGVNIIPKEPNDLWVVIGIAYFITDMFMKKLVGNNEYRFRQKTLSDRLCELDVSRPSLHEMGTLLSLDASELDFMALKAPLVLFILDRRLAKVSGSLGLSRIVARLFLNAKAGDSSMANGALTTAQFLRTCEKLGHAKLDSFFDQWVYGAGCPRFLVTQRFNKKKLVVEMTIKQTQSDQNDAQELQRDTFMRDVKEEIYKVDAEEVQKVFTGPMTIRIHEADGTPYEHIVEIKEQLTRFDIPYNTKYKRMKRSRRQKERAAVAAGIDISADAQDDVLLYCLGDVLQSEEEVSEWRLADWTREDEDRMSQESYEWIRMDADFEWLCKMQIVMPGYMYLSQLQQDRDVVAQYESVQYIASQRETALVSTILVRTLMDRRYYHGIRTTAARALAKNGREDLNWIGLYHLERAFQEFFCFPDSQMTRTNDFSDRTAYYIQCAIPQAMATVRGLDGSVPLRAKRFLFDKLKFNDNVNNEYSDCHYVAMLMTALSESLIKETPRGGFDLDPEDEMEIQEDLSFEKAAIEEIERYRRMDEWISSYQNTYSITAIQCKERLAKAKVIAPEAIDFLQYTRDGMFDPLRLQAFGSLVALGMLRDEAILTYFLSTLRSDPSPFVRENLQRLFGTALAGIALGETRSTSTEALPDAVDGLVIEHESTRAADLKRTGTVVGALAALEAELGGDETLKRELWKAVTSPDIGLFQVRDLLDICSLLYDPRTSCRVILPYPRYWQVEHQGRGKMHFSPSPKIRLKPMPPPWKPREPSPPAPKAKDVASAPPEPQERQERLPKITFKKKPSFAMGAGSPPLASPDAGGGVAPAGKPKLTLKFGRKPE
ncbi:MAG: hypothetical protein M1817_005098 [Caeruleum heppii]|nr:MAG: hypothetical protein M1817_005098 [Caeruleum heppii]